MATEETLFLRPQIFFAPPRRPNVPSTNKQSERRLRPAVIMRKAIHGTRSMQGTENHSVLRSWFETARRQGKKPHRFCLDLLTKDTAQAQAARYRYYLPNHAEPTAHRKNKNPL